MPVIGIFNDPYGDPDNEFLQLKEFLTDFLEYDVTFKQLESPDDAPVDVLILDYGGMTLPGASTYIDWMEDTILNLINDRPNCLIIIHSALESVYENLGYKVENIQFKALQWLKSHDSSEAINEINKHLKLLNRLEK